MRVLSLMATGCLLAAPTFSRAERLEIEISPQVAGEPMQANSLRYQTAAGESFSVTRLSYLLSGFALQGTDGSWLELTNQIAWMDVERGRSAIQMADVPE